MFAPVKGLFIEGAHFTLHTHYKATAPYSASEWDRVSTSEAVNCNGDGPGGTVVKIFQAVMTYWVTMV